MNESTSITTDETARPPRPGATVPSGSWRQRFLLWVRRAGPSLFYLGYFPVASGTVGSALAAGLIWLVHTRMPEVFTPAYLPHYWLGMSAVTALSILLSTNPRYLFGASDPKQIIIDEFAGQIVTFFMVPITWRTMILGFLLFRFYDIIKPFPVHKMEEIDDSVGVIMDDIIAGVLANITLLAILWAYHFARAALNA